MVSWFHDNLSYKDIAERLSKDHNIVCTDRTIQRRLKLWGAKKRSQVLETAALRLRIVAMFFMNFPDSVTYCTCS